MTPGVSVALCTCNGAGFIERQIESICTQTLPASEIVMKDDASEDDTVARARAAWERCRAQAPQATPALKIAVHSRRLGVSQNFESALADCTCELIALSDQDDCWHPERLERLVSRMQRFPAALLIHGNARLVDAQGAALGTTLFEVLGVSAAELHALSHGRGLDVLLNRNLVTGAATIFRQDLLQSALPIPTHWVHDEWLGVIAAAVGGLDVEQAPLLDYRQHGGNQIGARRKTLLDAVRTATGARGDWHTRRLKRAQELEARLAELSVPDAVMQAVREKVAHHRARAALPAQRLRRPLPILREWNTGRYRRFGRGLQGVVKDLLEGA